MKEKLKFLGKQIVLALYPPTREDVWKLYREGKKQEELLRLRAILPSEDTYKEAIEYYKKSVWNLQELYQYIAATCEIPPDEANGFPVETLLALRFRPLPKLDLTIKKQK